MGDIKAAEKRFRAAKELGADKVYDGDTELSHSDAYALASEQLKFRDATPLSGLKGKEKRWRSLGFEDVDGRWCRRIDRENVSLLLTVEPGQSVCLLTMSAGDKECEECDLTEHVKTLGQLRCLIAALGGDE